MFNVFVLFGTYCVSEKNCKTFYLFALEACHKIGMPFAYIN